MGRVPKAGDRAVCFVISTGAALESSLFRHLDRSSIRIYTVLSSRPEQH